MSILDTKIQTSNRQYIKTIFVYWALALLTYAINYIYGIFGHGVTSDAMTWMFLYPLLGGVLIVLLIAVIFSRMNKFKWYRFFCNLYHSGIATLTIGSFLKGILEIAGTSSVYIPYYFITGWILVISSLIILFSSAARQKSKIPK